LTYESLAFYVSALLSEKGTFTVIIPFSEKDNFKKLCKVNNLNAFKEAVVISKEGKLPNRVLMMFEKNQTNTKFFTITIREKNGTFSEDYKILVKDFLLDF